MPEVSWMSLCFAVFFWRTRPIRWHEWVSWQIPNCSVCTEASLSWKSLNFSLVPCLQHHVLHQKWKKILFLLDFLVNETWFMREDKKVVEQIKKLWQSSRNFLVLSGTWTKTLIILMASCTLKCCVWTVRKHLRISDSLPCMRLVTRMEQLVF